MIVQQGKQKRLKPVGLRANGGVYGCGERDNVSGQRKTVWKGNSGVDV
jgi:hypothetical protein